jgi:myb proto-oncogene protein
MELDNKSQKSNKKPWSPEEDEMLFRLVQSKGTSWKWYCCLITSMLRFNLYFRYFDRSRIAEKLNINRTGKQCRERYNNHLKPEIVKGNWTSEEDRIIIELKEQFGNQWTKIAKRLPGRSGTTIYFLARNFFYVSAVQTMRLRIDGI